MPPSTTATRIDLVLMNNLRSVEHFTPFLLAATAPSEPVNNTQRRRIVFDQRQRATPANILQPSYSFGERGVYPMPKVLW